MKSVLIGSVFVLIQPTLDAQIRSPKRLRGHDWRDESEILPGSDRTGEPAGAHDSTENAYPFFSALLLEGVEVAVRVARCQIAVFRGISTEAINEDTLLSVIFYCHREIEYFLLQAGFFNRCELLRLHRYGNRIFCLRGLELSVTAG